MRDRAVRNRISEPIVRKAFEPKDAGIALAASLPDLSDATLLHAESDTWLRSPSWLEQRNGHRPLVTAPSGEAASSWARTQDDFRAASHGYVHCFLQGYAPRRTRVLSGDCSDRGVLQARYGQRMAWLRRLDRRLGGRVRALGYSMNLSAVAASCCRRRETRGSRC